MLYNPGEEEKNVEIKLRNFRPEKQNCAVHLVVNACTSRDFTKDVKGVCFVGQDITSEKLEMDKFIRLEGDYKSIVQSLSPLIPPIFASDENACCCEWNAAMEKLTGWSRHDVIGKLLPGEIFGEICRLKSQDALTKFMILLYRGISGQDSAKCPFEFLDREGKSVEVFLTANKRSDINGRVIGCFCFLRIADMEDMQQPFQGQRVSKFKELAYVRQELRNPLSGIRFIHELLETTSTTENQKQFLETSYACERQIMTILEDMDLQHKDEG